MNTRRLTLVVIVTVLAVTSVVGPTAAAPEPLNALDSDGPVFQTDPGDSTDVGNERENADESDEDSADEEEDSDENSSDLDANEEDLDDLPINVDEDDVDLNELEEDAGTDGDNENESGSGTPQIGGGGGTGSIGPSLSPEENAEDLAELLRDRLRGATVYLIDEVINNMLGTPVPENDGWQDIRGQPTGDTYSDLYEEVSASDGSEEHINVTSDPAEQALYEAAYTVQIKQDAIGEFVGSEAVKGEWRRRAGELGFSSEVSNVIEQAPDEYLQRQRRDGRSVIKVTQEGLEYAGLAQDTGSSASGGGDEHRWVLTEAYRAFTRLGMFVELLTQEGDEDPDGIADLPIDPMEAQNPREMHQREEQLQDEYPHLYDLTEGLNISIEAET